MKSYIKIYGPPFLKVIRALEKIAVEMPEVCIMDTAISTRIAESLARDLGGEPFNVDKNFAEARARANFAEDYFASSGVAIPVERCSKIISRSGESLGEHDFFFEWFKEPTRSELNDLIGRIDEALAPLGCQYTLTTKR